jgi:hypothetical protein
MDAITSINGFLETYRVIVQLLGLGTFFYGVAWFLKSSKEELFGKLDKITDNHLHTIQDNTGKAASVLVEMQKGFAAHDQRAMDIAEEVRDFRAEVRSRPSECPLIKDKDANVS